MRLSAQAAFANCRSIPRQRGISLVIAIVFLLLLTVLALAGLRSSTTNVQIAGNMQARQEAVAAADVLLEQVLSTATFSTNPQGVKDNARYEADFNGDGKLDAIAVISAKPVCIRARPVPLASLDPTSAEDNKCIQTASAQNPGVIAAPAAVPQSNLCSDTEWDLEAEANDTATAAKAKVHQGVSIRVATVDLASSCK